MDLKKIKHVEEVAAWQLCCGCGACAAVCPQQIEMGDVIDYGRRPRFREGVEPQAAGESMQVCPGIALDRIAMPDAQLGGQEVYDVWGPVLGVWEGHAADEQVRFEGSSGGAATVLSLYAMQQQQMAGTLHSRCREDIPYFNETVFSRNREELLSGAGSRYAPASPCDGLDLIEKADGPCVFVGKPCDVAAVHRAEQLRPGLREKTGLKIAFFCAGTPTTHGTFQMFKAMGIEDPQSVTMVRYRGKGWPGMTTVEYRDSEGLIQQRQFTYDQSWGEVLQKYRQWRCYICPDHIGEYADIAVADAWHRPVEDYQPGRSVIIARTPRGKAMVEQAIKDGYLEAESVSSDILPQCRPGQDVYQAGMWSRLKTLKAMGVPTPDYTGFNLFQLWRAKLPFKKKVHSVLSTIKRVFVKELRKRRQLY